MAEPKRLKLRARDEEDLAVLSALLQDALIPGKEMTYLGAEKRFVLVANRFMWERQPDSPLGRPVTPPRPENEGDDASFAEVAQLPVFERVHTAVTFDRIDRVKVRGVDLKNRSGLYNLLSVKREPDSILMVFADDAMVRLHCRRVRAHMEDIGEPWPTHSRPGHSLDEEGNAG